MTILESNCSHHCNVIFSFLQAMVTMLMSYGLHWIILLRVIMYWWSGLLKMEVRVTIQSFIFTHVNRFGYLHAQ